MAEKRFDAFFQRVQGATGISNQNELADVLGVNRSAVTQARKKGRVPDRWMLGLFRRYGLNPDWLVTGQGNPFVGGDFGRDEGFRSIPKVRARLSAGGGSFEVDDRVEGYFAFDAGWLGRRGDADRMVLMDVFGNSMEPELRDGDTVLVDQAQKDVLAGAVFAVGIEDTIMVKRVEKHPSKLVLLSDNTRYAPIYLDEGHQGAVRIIGRVVWACRNFR